LTNGIYYHVLGSQGMCRLSDKLDNNEYKVKNYESIKEIIQIAVESVEYYVDLNMYNFEYGVSFR
jgi:hypothetical protein